MKEVKKFYVFDFYDFLTQMWWLAFITLSIAGIATIMLGEKWYAILPITIIVMTFFTHVLIEVKQKQEVMKK